MAANFLSQRFDGQVQKRLVVKAMIQVGAGLPAPVGMPLPLRWGALKNPPSPRPHLKKPDHRVIAASAGQLPGANLSFAQPIGRVAGEHMMDVLEPRHFDP